MSTRGVNVIADIAGRYDELMLLLDKMPKDCDVLSVGDMIDRGRQSNKVIDYFMNTPNARALMGNHEHLMIDHCTKGGYYDDGCWLDNGGDKTMESYFWMIPDRVISWAQTLPLYEQFDFDGKKFFVSHGPVFKGAKLETVCNLGSLARYCDEKIIWNRGAPGRRDELGIQIFGHNSHIGLREYKDDKGVFAICLDDSRKKRLTGIHLPSMEIFQQDYL